MLVGVASTVKAALRPRGALPRQAAMELSRPPLRIAQALVVGTGVRALECWEHHRRPEPRRV